MAACPGADDVYTVYRSRLTDTVYERLHLPVPIARGVGPTLVPRRVPLTCYLSKPLYPPPYDPVHEEDQVDALHAEACARMDELLQRA
jgi:hypothetical protein